MIIFKHNKMKDLVLYMLPAIVIVTFFCMKINYSMMDAYSFYKDLSMYDMYMIMMTDPSVEFLISIPFLLLIVNINIKMYKKWKIKMYNLGSTIHQLSYHQ